MSFAFISGSSNGRAQRNQAEKNRRDKLNKSVQQLGCHVRPIAGTSKRVDKTAILRLSAHGLRIEYSKSPHAFICFSFICSQLPFSFSHYAFTSYLSLPFCTFLSSCLHKKWSIRRWNSLCARRFSTPPTFPIPKSHFLNDVYIFIFFSFSHFLGAV